MKKPTRKNKVPRLFKLAPDLDTLLRKDAAKRGVKQTWIVERALRSYLAIPV